MEQKNTSIQAHTYNDSRQIFFRTQTCFEFHPSFGLNWKSDVFPRENDQRVTNGLNDPDYLKLSIQVSHIENFTNPSLEANRGGG